MDMKDGWMESVTEAMKRSAQWRPTTEGRGGGEGGGGYIRESGRDHDGSVGPSRSLVRDESIDLEVIA